jgi:hypothetical protein
MQPDLATLFVSFETKEFPTLENISSFPQPPSNGGYIYAVFWAVPNCPEVPLYVGQTQELQNRMWDYCKAHFKACTDFRVGEAVKYLRGKGCRVTVRYNACDHPRSEERRIIRELQVSGPRLINGLVAYDYATCSEEEERRFIQRFCDLILRQR